jgi:transcription antitermination factor NusG
MSPPDIRLSKSDRTAARTVRKLVDVRNGQKHATERKFFPAYVLAKMELTDGGLPPQRRRF